MDDYKHIRLFLLSLFTLIWGQTHAQCRITNTAFQSGELLKYDMYYKYGIINAKSGSGTLTTTLANYNGNRVYKTTLLANTSGTVGSLYTVHDTLTGYVDANIVPLYFEKQTFEGGDSSSEKQTYSYQSGKVNVRAIRYWKGRLAFDETVSTDQCAYDYISIINYCRNLDYSAMKPGNRVNIRFLSGKDIVNMYINYKGVKRVKVNNGKTYNAIELTMTIIDKAFANQKEAMKITLTNDSNKMPLIIEIGLKIGALRVILKDFSGIRYPIN